MVTRHNIQLPYGRGLNEIQALSLMRGEDPLECHRTLLVSRYLVDMGLNVQHILSDGGLESHASAIERLLEQLKLPSHDLFRTHQDVIQDAYRAQERVIAHVNESDASSVLF
jgi:hypothetical protein